MPNWIEIVDWIANTLLIGSVVIAASILIVVSTVILSQSLGRSLVVFGVILLVGLIGRGIMELYYWWTK